MKLNRNCLSSVPGGVEAPRFDVDKMLENTEKTPQWIHFGAGNIFRSFMAPMQQKLLDMGLAETGIIATETYDYEIIDRVYTPYDNLSLLALMEASGNFRKTLVASVAKGIRGDDYESLKKIFTSPSLQIVSFTITEKGYAIKNIDNEYFPAVEEDMKTGGRNHAMSAVTALLYERYLQGGYPIALLSLDNCSHNGEKLMESILDIAQKWCLNGITEKGFVDYLTDKSKVSYPWSMIDKITPRPAPEVQAEFEKLGFEDMKAIITEKHTYIAPFVNAEVAQYLVVEDDFPNGRPPLEKAGVYFTDRDTVTKAETMKVTTCLNPLHTALAVFGCLLGYTKISDEMKDDDLSQLVNRIGYEEGMKVVVHPGIIQPAEFLREVIGERLPNPFIPDAPQRIATDTSQKLAIRFGETIRAYHQSKSLDAGDLKYIPFVLAGWLRYLMAVDDAGKPMDRSPDPMLSEMDKAMEGIALGNAHLNRDKLKPILSNEKLFGINLYDCGLGIKVEDMFIDMSAETGAVRRALEIILKH